MSVSGSLGPVAQLVDVNDHALSQRQALIAGVHQAGQDLLEAPEGGPQAAVRVTLGRVRPQLTG